MSNYFDIFNIIFKDLKDMKMMDLLTLDAKDINSSIKKNVNKISVRNLTPFRIGHLAMNTEEFLRYYSLHEEEYLTRKEVVILVNNEPFEAISNHQLLTMIKRKFPVVDSSFFISIIKYLAQADPELWDFSEEKMFYGHVLNKKTYNDCIPQLTFSEEEELQGKQLLKKIGINDNEEFVCFHNRDKAYLNQHGKGGNWSYHDYRDSNIANYMPTIDKLTQMGYLGVRMGQVVEDNIDSKNAKIIDYANQYRSDFGDIYLAAKCKFFIGSSTGITHVPSIFNVPVVMINVVPFGNAPFYKKDLYIPKKCWYKLERRFLTFNELIQSKVYKWGAYAQNYERLGIEVVENTAEEIWDVTMEMYERLNGTWITTEEDELLQAKLQSIYKEGVHCYGDPARMGTKFLWQNLELLE